MSDEYDFDLFVIGAGSGGVRASRVAAGHGARVAVAEEHKVGGTCVIRGCVPKKLLVYGAHFAEDLKDARRFGWDVPASTSFDWPTLRDNVIGEVDRLEGLYQQTLDNNKVTTFHERATIEGPHEIRLASGKLVTTRYILVATGAWPAIPDAPGAEYGITSNEVFHLEKMPRRVVIFGGGYIANEFAGIFHEFACDVTLVLRGDQMLRGYDEQIRDRLLQISLAKGIQFRFNAPLEKIEKNEDGTLKVFVGSGDPIEADLVLFATGRNPKIDGLGLDKVGVEIEKGAIKVDEYSRTNVENIYAVGDVTDRVQLTPVAIREGHAFADTVFGNNPRAVDYSCIPSAVFSNPPIGAVGMTEGEARNKLGSVQVYTSDFRPMKFTLAGRNERSLYKLVCNAETGQVVGIHMIGPDAPEILQAAAIAVKAGLTKADFDATVALHPSMAEELVLMR